MFFHTLAGSLLVCCGVLLALILSTSLVEHAHGAYSIARDEPYDNETYVDVILQFTRQHDFTGSEQSFWPFLNKLCRNPRYLSTWHADFMGTYPDVQRWRYQVDIIGTTSEFEVLDAPVPTSAPIATTTTATTSVLTTTAVVGPITLGTPAPITTTTTATTTTTIPVTTTVDPGALPSVDLPPFFRQICAQSLTASDMLNPFRPIDFKPWEASNSTSAAVPAGMPDYEHYSDYPFLASIAAMPRVNIRPSLTTRQPVLGHHDGDGKYVVTLFIRGTEEHRDTIVAALNGNSPIPELNEYYRNELGILEAHILTEPAQLYWQTTDSLVPPLGLELDAFWSSSYEGLSSQSLSIGWVLTIIAGLLIIVATIGVLYYRRGNRQESALEEEEGDDGLPAVEMGVRGAEPLLEEAYDNDYSSVDGDMEGGGADGGGEDYRGYYDEDGEWYWSSTVGQEAYEEEGHGSWGEEEDDGPAGVVDWEAPSMEGDDEPPPPNRSNALNRMRTASTANPDEEDLDPIVAWRPGMDRGEVGADRHLWKVPNIRADLSNKIAKKEFEQKKRDTERRERALGRRSRIGTGGARDDHDDDDDDDDIPEADRILNHDIAKRRAAALQGGITNLEELLARRNGITNRNGGQSEHGSHGHRYTHPVEKETTRPSASEWTIDALEGTMAVEEGFHLPPIREEDPLGANVASASPPLGTVGKGSNLKGGGLGSRQNTHEELDFDEEEGVTDVAAAEGGGSYRRRGMKNKAGVLAPNDPRLSTYNPKDVVLLEEYYDEASDLRHQALYGESVGGGGGQVTSSPLAARTPWLSDLSAPSRVAVNRSALVLPVEKVKNTKHIDVRRLEAAVRAKQRLHKIRDDDVDALNSSMDIPRRAGTVILDSLDAIEYEARLAALRAEERTVHEGMDEDGFLFYDEQGRGFRSVREYEATRQVDPFSIRNKATLGLAARREAHQVKQSLDRVINSLGDTKQGGGTFNDAANRIAVNGVGPFGSSRVSRFSFAGNLFHPQEGDAAAVEAASSAVADGDEINDVLANTVAASSGGGSGNGGSRRGSRVVRMLSSATSASLNGAGHQEGSGFTPKLGAKIAHSSSVLDGLDEDEAGWDDHGGGEEEADEDGLDSLAATITPGMRLVPTDPLTTTTSPTDVADRTVSIGVFGSQQKPTARPVPRRVAVSPTSLAVAEEDPFEDADL